MTNQDKVFQQKGALLPFLIRIFKYAWRYKKDVKIFAFSIMMIAFVDAFFPIVLKMMLDNALTPELQNIKANQIAGTPYLPDFTKVYLYSGIFLGFIITSSVAMYFFIKHTGKVQEYVLADLRQELFEKLQKLSFSYYDRNASGWLLSRLTSDTDRVAEIIAWGLIEAIWGTGMIIFCLASLTWFSWKLALIVALSIPLMLLLSIRIRMLVLKYSRQSRKINSELTASFTEHINGVEIVKSMAQEKKVGAIFGKVNQSMRTASYKSAYYTAMYFPVVVLVGSLAAASVIFFGGQMAITAPPIITVGLLAAAFDYTLKIFFPIVDLSRFYANAQGSLSAGERIFSLLEEPITIKNHEKATDFGHIKGHIAFEQVNFQYTPDHPVLTDFNLSIQAGQSVALVGATGEGKSTIINLIGRFYEPTNGTIRIDGQDYRLKTIESLRSSIGVVLQTPHLFSGSIRENILYGKLDATDEDIIACLKVVGAEQFETQLDLEVGENGENLSMGERQLISFARAILSNPRIIIMDEATASIDTLTEAKIQQGIQEILKNRTAVIIAHRLSTIKSCDRILVIQKGRIIEDGNHAELMKQRGKYFNLYTKQLREVQLESLIK